MKKEVKKAYIAGALTNVAENKKDVYYRIGEVCKNLKIEPYIPHLCGYDPVKNFDVVPKFVWYVNSRELISSDILIAYAGEPSLGVGSEMEMARINAIDIILWWIEGDRVSRMARGNPAVVEIIEVKNTDDACEKIKQALIKKYDK